MKEQRLRAERGRFKEVPGGRANAKVLLEAATESEWVAQWVEALGHEVVVAAPNFAPMYGTRTRRVGLLRAQLSKTGAVTAEQLQKAPIGKTVWLGGLGIVRQRPPTAKGLCQYRKEVAGTALVLAVGRVERNGKVVNLKVAHLEPLMPEAGRTTAGVKTGKDPMD